MSTKTVTVNVYTPYPEFYWEAKLAGGAWGNIEDYAAYNRADNTSDETYGQGTPRVNIDAVDGEQAFLRCTIGPQSAGVPTPGAAGTVTTDDISVSIGSLTWDVDVSQSRTIQTSPIEDVTVYAQVSRQTGIAGDPYWFDGGTDTNLPQRMECSGQFTLKAVADYVDEANPGTVDVGGHTCVAKFDGGTIVPVTDGDGSLIWVRTSHSTANGEAAGSVPWAAYDGITAETSINLDWFELDKDTGTTDIAAVIGWVRAAYCHTADASDLYLRAPSVADVLCQSEINLDVGVFIENFKLFDGGAGKTISSVDNTQLVILRHGGTAGGTSENFFIEAGVTFVGHLGDPGQYADKSYLGEGFIKLSGQTFTGDVDIQCDVIDAPVYGLYLGQNMASATSVTLGGRYINGGVNINTAWANIHFNNLIYDDRAGRSQTLSGDANLNEKFHKVSINKVLDITGQITLQYGFGNWFMSIVGDIGNSAQDPFIIAHVDKGRDQSFNDLPKDTTSGVTVHGGKMDQLESLDTADPSSKQRYIQMSYARSPGNTEPDDGVYNIGTISENTPDSDPGAGVEKWKNNDNVHYEFVNFSSNNQAIKLGDNEPKLQAGSNWAVTRNNTITGNVTGGTCQVSAEGTLVSGLQAPNSSIVVYWHGDARVIDQNPPTDITILNSSSTNISVLAAVAKTNTHGLTIEGHTFVGSSPDDIIIDITKNLEWGRYHPIAIQYTPDPNNADEGRVIGNTGNHEDVTIDIVGIGQINQDNLPYTIPHITTGRPSDDVVDRLEDRAQVSLPANEDEPFRVLIDTLITQGIWDAIDEMFCYGFSDPALKKVGLKAIDDASSSPNGNFNTNGCYRQGSASASSNAGHRVTVNPLTYANDVDKNYSQDNAWYMFYTNGNGDTNTNTRQIVGVGGVNSYSTTYRNATAMRMTLHSSSATQYVAVDHDLGPDDGPPALSWNRMYLITRNGATLNAYSDGELAGTLTSASATPSDQPIRVGSARDESADENLGTCPAQNYAFWAIGGDVGTTMDAGKIQIFYAALNTYLTDTGYDNVLP